MTTLPTREDGGVDWNKLVLQAWGAYWITGDKVPSMIVFGTLELAKAIETHTIERCAKVADGVALSHYGITASAYASGCLDGAKEARDKIRKLEP